MSRCFRKVLTRGWKLWVGNSYQNEPELEIFFKDFQDFFQIFLKTFSCGLYTLVTRKALELQFKYFMVSTPSRTKSFYFI